jgi:3-oxoacyl-[acyl-carrier protein] reductase
MQTVLITGGTRGIGHVFTTRFLEAGYRVVACARSADSISRAQALAAAAGDRLRLVQADVSQEEEVRALLAQTTADFGGVDVLVNNAGIIGPIGPSQENDTAAWLGAFQTNIIGPFLTCKHCVPRMLAAGFGRIINLSGGGATSPTLRFSAYSASKAALVRFTETLALELRDANVTVNAIAPGFICTEIHEQTWAAGPKAAGVFYGKSRQKWASGGDDPSRAAALALFLASPDCRLTGRLISAIYDPWETFRDAPPTDDSLYTLRRIDNMFYQSMPKS